MRYIKPEYFDKFYCTADKCPDTCCAGWQIMIDETSLKRYYKERGSFGKRLQDSIDWQEGCFYQYGRSCAFLNEENLCDLYTALGEGALCDTCRNYPRHVEEYEGLREMSLSLSCPVAAEMLLSEPGFPKFLVTEDDKPEELEEEFEAFDYVMFIRLEDARSWVLKHLEKTTAEGALLENNMGLYLQMAAKMQDCVEREQYFEIDTVVRNFEAGNFMDIDSDNIQTSFTSKKERFRQMSELERLRQEWTGTLEETYSVLYAAGEEQYDQHRKQFAACLKKDTKARELWEQMGVRLFVFFLYTYFCGAVYDDWIYSKMALAAESVRFIRELYLARWVKAKKLEWKDYVELAYRYAREIEHSDENLNALEEIFMTEC